MTTGWSPDEGTEASVEELLSTLLARLPYLIGVDELVPGCEITNVDTDGVGVGVVPRYISVRINRYVQAVYYRGGITINVGDLVNVVHFREGDIYEVLSPGGTSGQWSVGGGGGAPTNAQYVVMALDATLTAERVLTGTANQVTVTDGGAGGNVTLSTPQNIHTAATPTFGALTLNGNLSVRSQNEVRFYDNGNYVGFEAGALSADQIWILPTADGNPNDVLSTNGAGTLSWVAGGGAPVGAQYVVLAVDATLTAERVLTGTANQVTVTDGGAGGNVTLSTPQDIHTGASPQFSGLTVGVGGAGVDYYITFDGQDSDGVIRWMEDEDAFEIDDQVDFQNRVSFDNYITVTAAGPTDNLDVADVNVVRVDTSSNDVTIGGMINGVSGQVLWVVVVDNSNDLTLEHAEGTGNQDMYLYNQGDKTLVRDYGGIILVCDGSNWFQVGGAGGSW